jgi:hypothetical protein
MLLSRRLRVLRGALWLNLALLTLVFLLGMTVNLYLAFPSNLPAQLAMRSPSVQAHMIVATLIVLVGLVALVLSVLERHVWGIATTAAGVALALLAYGGGMGFLNAGYQESASMMMAIGFIGAFIAYGLAAYVTAPKAAPALAQRQ